MAEYYPLISRAVAGLRDGAPEARQAIYGRARQALVGQLRGMQPPVPEEAIVKEITALDNAIARIESELAPPKSLSDLASDAVAAALSFDLPAAPPATPVVAAPVIAAPAVAAPSVPEPAAPVVRPDPAPVAVSPKPPASRPVAPPPVRPALMPTTPRAERTPFTPRPTLPGRAARPDVPLSPAIPAVAKPAEPAIPPLSVGSASPALPMAPTLDTIVAEREPKLDGGVTPSIDAVTPAAPGALPVEARVRDEAGRPSMPRQAARQPRNLRIWIVAVAALAAVVVIALTAWKLRDRPEELARVPTPAAQVDTTPGKIVERADGTAPAAEDDTNEAQAVGASAATATALQAGTPQTATQQIATQQAVTPAQGGSPAASPAGEPSIPVSYKAAVLVAAPDTPEKVKTYVGTVVWRTENVSAGDGQPVATAVRADIDVPDAKLQMSMEIRKNTEAQFPASHTIDIKFTPGSGSPMGNVKQIDVPQMRREDAPTGDPLVGVPVTITSNYFLVGLTRGDAETRNVEAMRSRGWFDIPMVLEDGKPAKITFEKGATGDRIVADALASWAKP